MSQNAVPLDTYSLDRKNAALTANTDPTIRIDHR